MNVRFWLPLALLALLAGCNKSDGPAGAPSSGAVPSAGDAPDVQLKQAVDKLTSGDAAALWTMLPAKRQADVTAVVHEAAGKLDAEVYNRGFGLVAKLGAILKSKKDYLLASTVLPMSAEDRAEFAKLYPQLSDAVEALAQSEIKSLDGLKNVDPGKFLATTGSKVLGDVIDGINAANATAAADLAMMKSSRFELVKQDGDKATLRRVTEGSEPQEFEVQKVEGKWVPLDMLKTVDEGVASARENLGALEMTADTKQQILSTIGIVETLLDGLAKTSSQNEFDGALAQIVNMAKIFVPSVGPPAAATGPVGLGVPAQTGPGSLPAPGTLPNPSGVLAPPSPVGPSLPGTGTPGNPNVPAGVPTGVLPSGGPTLPSAGPTVPAAPK